MPNIDFNLETQNPYQNLCWAAVSFSVDRWRAQPGHWTQLCELFHDLLTTQPDSCGAPDLSAFDDTGSVVDVLQQRGHFNQRKGRPNQNSLAASMDDRWNFITSTIDDGRVICASIAWKRGGGHEIVIYGYEEDPGDVQSRTVNVLDPKYEGCFSQLYSSFMRNYRQKLGECEFLNSVHPKGV